MIADSKLLMKLKKLYVNETKVDIAKIKILKSLKPKLMVICGYFSS